MPSRRRVVAGALALVGGAGCLGDSTLGGATDDGTGDSDTDEASDGNHDTAIDDAGANADDVLFTVSDGGEEAELATYADVATVGEVDRSRHADGYLVPVTLTDDGATAFADVLDAIGAFEDPTAHEIRTHLDGEVIYAATLGADLAAAIEEGNWDGEMLMQSENRETAEEMRAALGGA